MDTKQIEEQLKEFANQWRAKFEEMQTQFSLGKMDAGDAFEKQKDTFKKLVLDFKESIDKATDTAKENVTVLKSKLEDLQVQLSLGKADGTEAFEEQKKKIEIALNEVFIEGRKFFNTNFDLAMQQFDNTSQLFKTGMEILKLQFSLGKMDSKDKVDELQKSVSEKINEMNIHFKQAQEIGKQNLDIWTKLMKENYEKMKSFSDDWMKKNK
jgi:hypothetical protein